VNTIRSFRAPQKAGNLTNARQNFWRRSSYVEMFCFELLFPYTFSLCSSLRQTQSYLTWKICGKLMACCRVKLRRSNAVLISITGADSYAMDSFPVTARCAHKKHVKHSVSSKPSIFFSTSNFLLRCKNNHKYLNTSDLFGSRMTVFWDAV
jgi:hypothetical protein